jgi:hypothetical protein
VLASIHREGDVLSEEVAELGMLVRARLDDASAKRLAAFTVTPTGR